MDLFLVPFSKLYFCPWWVLRNIIQVSLLLFFCFDSSCKKLTASSTKTVMRGKVSLKASKQMLIRSLWLISCEPGIHYILSLACFLKCVSFLVMQSCCTLFFSFFFSFLFFVPIANNKNKAEIYVTVCLLYIYNQSIHIRVVEVRF